jgi:hypothetical protein
MLFASSKAKIGKSGHGTAHMRGAPGDHFRDRLEAARDMRLRTWCGWRGACSCRIQDDYPPCESHSGLRLAIRVNYGQNSGLAACRVQDGAPESALRSGMLSGVSSEGRVPRSSQASTCRIITVTSTQNSTHYSLSCNL